MENQEITLVAVLHGVGRDESREKTLKGCRASGGYCRGCCLVG